MRDALVCDAIRTHRGLGREGGAFAEVAPIDLVGQLLRELSERRGLDSSMVGDLVLGCVTQTGDQGADLAKVAAVCAGWDDGVSGATVNRFCTSGLDAIGSAAARIRAGFDDLIVAGGVESMSRVPMLSDGGAWFTDERVAAATGWVHMGVAADLVASMHGITRAQADAWALRSHARAAAAWAEGRFPSVVPVGVDEARDLDRDEAIRDGLTAESMARLPAPFASFVDERVRSVVAAHAPGVDLQHVHTVGTAPAVVDAAALTVVASPEAAASAGLRPRARIAAVAHASVDPVVMLTGPALAAERALAQAGLTADDVDLFECNESFAAVPLVFARALGIEDRVDECLNVNGGAIAMGHPLGATGAILVGTVLDELERRDGSAGLVTIPGGAGVAMAVVVERV